MLFLGGRIGLNSLKFVVSVYYQTRYGIRLNIITIVICKLKRFCFASIASAVYEHEHARTLRRCTPVPFSLR